MAKKPRKHGIESLSDAYLIKVFHDWNYNKLDNDYGIDFFVEIFHNTMSSGLVFGVQNKATDDIGNYQNGCFTFSMKTDHLKDYLMQPFPVFLHLYDTQKELGYWLNLYLYCNDVLDKEKHAWREQKYVTCYIPKENKLEHLNKIIDSVMQSRLRYIGKNSDSLKSIRKINYQKVINWAKKSEDFNNVPPQIPNVFSYVINLHYNRHLYLSNTGVLFPTSEDGIFIQHIHNFTSMFNLYKDATLKLKNDYISKIETYAKQHKFKLEKFYHKDFQILGFTSSITFEKLTETKFLHELKQIRNGIYFMVVYFISLFVDMPKYTQRTIDILKSLDYYHSEKETGLFKVITLKIEGFSISPTLCLIDSQFGRIYLKNEQKYNVFGVEGEGYSFTDKFNKFAQEIKIIGEKFKTTGMVYHSPTNRTKFEKYLNIHLVHSIPLSKVSKDYFKKRIKNICKVTEETMKSFKEYKFFSMDNPEGIIQK